MSDLLTFIDYSFPVINTYSANAQQNEGAAFNTSIGGALNAAWSSANQAIYISFRIGYPATFQKMFWINAAIVGNNNVDVGVYDNQNNQLWHSGSTLTSGASAVQSVTISGNLTLQSGIYYMAMAVNGTTDKFIGATLSNAYQYLGFTLDGFGAQSTAFPLPSTASLSAMTSGQFVPILALTMNSLI